MTPYDVVAALDEPQPATKGQLLAEVRRLERSTIARRPHTVVATLQDMRFVTELTCAIYAELGAGGAEVTLIARDLPAYVCGGVRGVALTDADPLVDVWSVIAIGEGFGTTFAATDRHGPDHDDMAREFEAARSSDLDVALRCLDTLQPYLV